MNTTQNSTKSKIVKVIGVDLAKDHCDVIGYDENGKICLRLDGCSYARKLFKNPCSQAELNKIVPFGFSLQRQKMVFFCHRNSIILLC